MAGRLHGRKLGCHYDLLKRGAFVQVWPGQYGGFGRGRDGAGIGGRGGSEGRGGSSEGGGRRKGGGGEGGREGRKNEGVGFLPARTVDDLLAAEPYSGQYHLLTLPLEKKVEFCTGYLKLYDT